MTTQPQLTEEQKAQLEDAVFTVGELAAKVLAYKIYRRLGAPAWAAWFIVGIMHRLGDILESLEIIEDAIIGEEE